MILNGSFSTIHFEKSILLQRLFSTISLTAIIFIHQTLFGFVELMTGLITMRCKIFSCTLKLLFTHMFFIGF